MLVYALIYAGTGLDNASNILGPEVVRMVNEFTGKKCAEVRNERPTHVNAIQQLMRYCPARPETESAAR